MTCSCICSNGPHLYINIYIYLEVSKVKLPRIDSRNPIIAIVKWSVLRTKTKHNDRLQIQPVVRTSMPQSKPRWWFQPIWKIWVKICQNGNLLQIGVKKKYLKPPTSSCTSMPKKQLFLGIQVEFQPPMWCIYIYMYSNSFLFCRI